MTFRIDYLHRSEGTDAWSFDIKGIEGRGVYGTLVTNPEGRALYLEDQEHLIPIPPGTLLLSATEFCVPANSSKAQAMRILALALLRLGWGPEVNQQNKVVSRPPANGAEAAMIAHARNAVLNSAQWLTSEQMAKHAAELNEFPPQVNDWKEDGLIFSIDYQNTDYFPAYGLDANVRPVKALAAVIATFQGSKDGWDLACWFASVNSFLGGRRPQDLLGTAPNEVIAAAADEVAGVAHG
ncbi:MAG: hypothetical protein Q7U80_04915 [Thiobacillus sp.]|nr:hypothetical protein [Thiobacillus sp.]